MITIEQLKDVKERTAALERYLDIENKQVQVEEEQLRPTVNSAIMIGIPNRRTHARYIKINAAPP